MFIDMVVEWNAYKKNEHLLRFLWDKILLKYKK